MPGGFVIGQRSSIATTPAGELVTRGCFNRILTALLELFHPHQTALLELFHPHQTALLELFHPHQTALLELAHPAVSFASIVIKRYFFPLQEIGIK